MNLFFFSVTLLNHAYARKCELRKDSTLQKKKNKKLGSFNNNGGENCDVSQKVQSRDQTTVTELCTVDIVHTQTKPVRK